MTLICLAVRTLCIVAALSLMADVSIPIPNLWVAALFISVAVEMRE